MVEVFRLDSVVFDKPKPVKEESIANNGIDKPSSETRKPVEVGEVVTPFIYSANYKQVWKPFTVPPQGSFRLVKMVAMERVGPRDLDILTCLYRWKFLTRDQIYKLCFAPSCSYAVAKKRLKSLFNLRLISMFVWGEDEHTTSNIPVYCLAGRGDDLLKIYRGLVNKRWHESYNNRDMEYVFRVLVTNEWMIRLMENSVAAGKDEGIMDFQMEPRLRNGKKSVIPLGMFSYKNGDMCKTFLFDAVRSTDNLRDSLKSYGAYFRSFKVDDEKPVLLMAVQDEVQALKVWQLITEMGLSFMPIRFTTDARMIGLKPYDPGAIFRVVGGAIEDSQAEIFEH